MLVTAVAAGVAAAVAAAVWFALGSEDNGSSGRRAPADPSTYFIDRSELLLNPSQDLLDALDMGILSWEEPTTAGADPTMRFSVQLRNNHPRREIAVADVIVVLAAGTAPEARLRKREFLRTLLPPGGERTVEVVTEPVPAEPREEDEERFGLHLYAVAGFADDVPAGWRDLATPTDAAAFKEVWGRFAWLEEFMEVSPEILSIHR